MIKIPGFRRFRLSRTTQFKTERELQDAIQEILIRHAVHFGREAKIIYQTSRSRGDFLIPDYSLMVEAKNESRGSSFDRALGQCLRNAVDHLCRTWLVVPDRLEIRQDQVKTAQAIGARIVQISEFEGLISSGEYKVKTGFGFLDAESAFYERKPRGLEVG